jgi:hypothetical protein
MWTIFRGTGLYSGRAIADGQATDTTASTANTDTILLGFMPATLPESPLADNPHLARPQSPATMC